MKKIVAAILLVFFVIQSCKKYDEGPRISWYSKTERVAGNWVFRLVKYNDIDSTVNYSNTSMEFLKDGRFSYVVVGENYGDLLIIPGNWEFYDDKNNINMSFYPIDGDVYNYNWTIKRLTFYDLWIERDDEDNNHIRWELYKSN